MIDFKPEEQVRIITGLSDIATYQRCVGADGPSIVQNLILAIPARYPHKTSVPTEIYVHPRYMPKDNDQAEKKLNSVYALILLFHDLSLLFFKGRHCPGEE